MNQSQVNLALARANYQPEIVEVYKEEVRLAAREQAKNQVEAVRNQLEIISENAVNRLEKLVDSPDENVATRNVHYVIDHIIGKPMQRSQVQQTTINIDIIAD